MKRAITSRTKLHQLVDELPESEIAAAERFLAYLRHVQDPVLRALLEAPEDDEPETEEERAAVAEAYKDLKAGRVVGHEQIKRDFGP